MIGSNKNIVRMIESFHTPLYVHMVMEVVSGGNIQTHVMNSDEPLTEVPLYIYTHSMDASCTI